MFLPRLAPRFDVALRDARSSRAEFRLEAARSLGLAENDEERSAARAALALLLEDELARIRAAALDSLGKVGGDADVPTLLAATADGRPAIREAAAMALGALGTEKAIAALRTLVDAPAPEVRFQAIEGLAARADSVSAAAVAAHLADEDAYVREAAASALSVLGADAHRDALAGRLGDEPPISLAAALALASVDDVRALPRLRAHVREGRPSTEALLALVRMRDERVRDDLAAIVARRLAPRATRIECAAALGALGDERGLAHLRAMLASFRDGPRVEALAFVARFAVVGCAPEVAALVDHPRGLPIDAIAHTLERLEPSAAAREALGRIDRLRTNP